MPDSSLPLPAKSSSALERQLAVQRARRPADPLLSLVVPVFNEDESIEIFLTTVEPFLERAALCFEIVFVNDGSRDDTLARLLDCSRRDPRIRVVNLSRNFGKEAALTAGIDHARGDILIPMDIDLQDPPDLFGPFIERWREGYDIVYGVRETRALDTASKRLSAKWFYWVFNSMSPVPIPANVGDFRLVDRRAVQVLRQLPERNRFMKGLFAWAGFKQTAVEYDRVERTTGTTKFNYWKLWTLALDGITSASTVPLRIWSYVGAAFALVALAHAAFIVSRTLLFGNAVPGYASIMVSVLFLGGMQLLSLGILGEYVGRILTETKQRPLYIVRDTVGIDS